MAIHTADAIILRKKDIRETSLLVVFYTRDFGKIRGLIKGVRGPRGSLGYQGQIFSFNTIVFYDSNRSAVHTVSHCDLIDFFESIREDILKTSYACYFIELVDAITVDKDKNENIFDLLLNSLQALKSDASPKRIARIFEIKLLIFSGLMPRVENYILKGRGDGYSRRILPGTANFMEHVGRAPYEKLARVKVSKDVGQELEGVMRDFLSYQLDTKIRSLEFLEKIQADHRPQTTDQRR